MTSRAVRQLVLVLGFASALPAQDTASASPSPRAFARSVWRDQATIFTSPAHLRKRDWTWILPAAGVTAFLVATDNRTMQERIHTDAAARNRSAQFSNLGVGSLAAIPTLLLWRGWRDRDNYQEQTAWMAARGVADAVITTEIIRAVTLRERPSPQGSGDFFRAGATSAAFPSMHAASAWALASVLAHRYPGWLTKAMVYGLAGGVSVSRVLAAEHSPSDVAVGSGLGWLIGRYVTREQHTLSKPFQMPSERRTEAPPTPSGSTYVPLDSWIYPALDRLAAFGLIPSQTSGLRPWTLAECRRQLLEAIGRLGTGNPVASELIRALGQELGRVDGAVTLRSLYTRNGVIAGPVLNDSFHVGQTWNNDSGRPFGRGWNSYSGFTASAESGPFFAYVDAEYQHAPATPSFELPVRQTLAGLDGVPLQSGDAVVAADRVRLLDTYVGARWGNVEVSVGKQSMWWGPTADSPLSFGTNAEPTKNFRIATVHPIRLPGPLRILGEIRGEAVIGKLGGQKYTWRPWFNAEKLTFKLTENLELGFTRWSLMWGVGHPITVDSAWRNLTSTYSSNGPGGVGATDPGDRKGGFDFRYRIPGLRNWLTLYSDSYADDDPSPLAAPRRAAINPGIYLAHVPGIPRLDFRAEAPSTMPMEGDMGGTFIYFNSQYRSGNTNYGYLLGNAVGRDARALQGRATYWFSPRARTEASYRQVKGGTQFLPGGSTQTDILVRNSFPLGDDFHASVTFQYERFLVPLLGGPQHNLSGQLQLTWEPDLPIVKKDQRH